MALFPRTLRSSKSPQQRGGSVFADRQEFFGRLCKLKLAPHRQRDGRFEAWLDLDPGSMCNKRIDFFLKPLPAGKFIRLLMEPRGAGKSTTARGIAGGTILDDHEITQTYNAQSEQMSKRAVRWCRAMVERADPRLVNPEDWSSEQFTVLRDTPTTDPTMLAGTPGGDVTGAHALVQWLEDVVNPESNSSVQKRKRLLEWWDALMKQLTPVTVVNAIGTRYPGHNLWEELIDHYADEMELMIVGCYDEATGQNFYPWIDDEWIKLHREKDPVGFDLQFMNKKSVGSDASFETSFLQYGEAPIISRNGVRRLDPNLAVYLLTDMAQTHRRTKHTSTTAMLVVALDHLRNIYVCDIVIGRFDPGTSQNKFLDLYARWRPHGLRYALMEDRGPGRDFQYTIPQLARARGVEVPGIVDMPRASADEKDSRIACLYEPFSNHRVWFVKEFLDPDMFRIDSRGMPHGVFVQQYEQWSKESESERDALDALCDVVALRHGDPACPMPGPPREERHELTNREWSERRALGRLSRVIVV